MHRLGTYLPQDRLRALTRGDTLPDQAQGSVIFADISGFTRLTEKLTRALGPRKGVEALSQQLNAVYGTLIDQMERCGGSIISFAGDSIIGWLEEKASGSTSLRAVTYAQDMQAAMKMDLEQVVKFALET